MLLQSHGGTIRVFPAVPDDWKDVSFTTLRAEGAFLVSAEFKAGIVGGVKIVSEKGRRCTVANPWSLRKVQAVRNGTVAEEFSGERFTFTTSANETIELTPGRLEKE
jgi:hypothetical protein